MAQSPEYQDGLALAMNFFSYWFSDKIVLSMYGAQEVSPAEAPQLHP